LPATAEQGHAILDSLAVSWAAAITELHELRWASREEATWSRAQHTGFIQPPLA
jgi:creatinine amidohydrolase